MTPKLIVVIVATWFIFMVLAILNAIIRETVFKPKFDELTAHQISTIILMIVIFIVTYLMLRFSNFSLDDSQALMIGTIWIIGAVVFEFIAGHYVFGNSWETLLRDYNILQGKIWILVLITIFLAPYLTNKLIK